MSSKTYKRTLTCHRDSDPAVAVCGKCSKPVCEDHHRTMPFLDWEYHDSTFHEFRSGFGKLIVIGLLLVALIGIVFVVPPNLFIDLTADLTNENLMIRPALVQSLILLILAGILTLWIQPSEQTFNFRILARKTHNRKLCEECYSETVPEQALFWSLGLAGYLIMIFGLFQIVTQMSLLPLRLVVVGILVRGLRRPLILYGSALLG